jgi:hypothetical protein
MIWALLALLGVPIWLIVGILGGAIWNRRTFQRRPGVFKLAKREVGATGWKRKSVVHARSISNVLVTNGGLALVRTHVGAIQGVSELDLDAVPHGFDDPVGRRLAFDGGRELEFAVEREFVGEIDSLSQRSSVK